jgi:hypothetical protein
MPQEAVIKSRVAVRHYGVKASSIYHEDEDAGQHKWWDEYFASYRVMKMTWYIETVCSLRFPLLFLYHPHPPFHTAMLTKSSETKENENRAKTNHD